MIKKWKNEIFSKIIKIGTFTKKKLWACKTCHNKKTPCTMNNEHLSTTATLLRSGWSTSLTVLVFKPSNLNLTNQFSIPWHRSSYPKLLVGHPLPPIQIPEELAVRRFFLKLTQKLTKTNSGLLKFNCGKNRIFFRSVQKRKTILHFLW